MYILTVALRAVCLKVATVGLTVAMTVGRAIVAALRRAVAKRRADIVLKFNELMKRRKKKFQFKHSKKFI